MSYSSVAEFRAQAINPAALSDISDSVIQSALDSASEELNGFFKKRYSFPIISVGSDVKRKEIDIATYLVLKGRGYNPAVGADTTIRDDYLDAIKWAQAVAKGESEPNIVDSTPTDDEGGPIVTSQAAVGWAAAGFPQTDITQT